MRKVVLTMVLALAAMLLGASPATSSHGGEGGETGKARGRGTSQYGEFSFSGTRYASGHFHGYMTLRPPSGPFAGETVRAEVFCVSILANSARLLGRIENDPTERGLVFDVVDGFNAQGDVDTFRGLVTPAAVTGVSCGNSGQGLPVEPILSGDILVDDEFVNDFEF